MRPSDMKVLLTGATGGIGFELAASLVEQGAKLLLTGRDAGQLERVAAKLEGYDGVVEWVAADLATDDGRGRVIEAAKFFRGGINVLVNNAGINQFGRYGEQTTQQLESTLALHVMAPMHLTQCLLPVLSAATEALIVNVGSILGSIGLPGQVSYSASKFALHGFSEALRRELVDSPVSVIYVAPRSTDTRMNSAELSRFNEDFGVTSDAPQKVAGLILAAMTAQRAERFVGWPERLFVKINACLPRLVDRSLRKQSRAIQQAFDGHAVLMTSHGANQ